MQDNFSPDIDPEWMEEGWSGMRQLLDQDMPVQKRRPFAWVWWAAAVLAIGLSAGLLLINGMPVHPVMGQLPVPVKKAKANNRSEAAPAEQVMAVGTEAANQKTLASDAGHQPPVTIEPNQTTSPLNSLPAFTANERPTAGTTTQGTKVSKGIVSIPDAPAPSFSTLANTPLNILAAASPSPLKKQTHLELTDQPEITPPPVSGPWQPGIFAGVLYGPQEGSTGLEAGTFLTWKPKGQRWYSRLSLSYLQIRGDQQLDERQFALSNSRITDNPSLINLTTRAEVVHFANTAIRAGFQITPRLGLETGFFMAYLANAQQASQWTSMGDPVSSSGGTDGSQEILPSLDRTNRMQSTAGLSRWNAGWTTGLHYGVSDKILVALDYRSPLPKLTATPGKRSIFNRNIALSLFRSF